MSQNIIGLYMLNEQGGIPFEYLGGAPATLNGGITWSSGDRGPGLKTNGTTGYVNLGSALPVSAGVGSAFMRIYPTGGTADYPMLLCRAAGAGAAYEMAWGNGDLKPYYGGGGSVASLTAVTLNAWCDIGFASDGTTMNVYINGVQTQAGSKAWQTATGDVNICRRPSDAYFGVNSCIVDRVVIYRTCITPAGAKLLYEDPYCFMQPFRQRFWSIPAGGVVFTANPGIISVGF